MCTIYCCSFGAAGKKAVKSVCYASCQAYHHHDVTDVYLTGLSEVCPFNMMCLITKTHSRIIICTHKKIVMVYQTKVM